MITIDLREFYSFSMSVGVMYIYIQDQWIGVSLFLILDLVFHKQMPRYHLLESVFLLSKRNEHYHDPLGLGQRMREQGEKIGEKPGRKGGHP